MKQLTMDTFHTWLEMYGKASRENDPQASAALFAQDAKYYETPFDEPRMGHDAIYQYWSQAAQNLKDTETAFEILTVQDSFGIARWQSKFTVIESGKRLALDCLFVIKFNEDGLCQTFREWWHIQEIHVIPA
jgi:hypothetical protein